DRIAQLKGKTAEKKPLTGQDWKAVFALILLCIPVTFFWATYEQQGNTMNLWAQDFTNRRLIPGLIDWQIPVTWFQAFNPFMIFTFTPLLLSYWARKRKEANSLIKMVKGCALLALSYVLIAWASWHGGDIKVSWLWVAAYFAVITVGELHLSPISYSLFSKVAPVQVVSLMFA